MESPEYKFCPFCGKHLATAPDVDGKLRQRCLDCKWTHYPRSAVSVAAIIRDKNKILLVQRAREPFKGKWMFPAGFLDYGENPEKALVREVKEETGLEVLSFRYRELFQTTDDHREPKGICWVYEVEVAPGEIKNDLAENMETRWFNLENLPEIAWEGQRRILKKLQ